MAKIMWSGPEVPLHGESELELAEIRDDISENYKDSINTYTLQLLQSAFKNAVCCVRS